MALIRRVAAPKRRIPLHSWLSAEKRSLMSSDGAPFAPSAERRCSQYQPFALLKPQAEHGLP